MFSNIGGKIKVFVIVLTILQIITCIVCGIGVIALSVFGENVIKPLSKIGLDGFVVNLAGDIEGPIGIVMGLAVMIIGSFAAWLIAFIPYGLGQLIQNTDKMVKGMDGIRAAMARNAANAANASSQPAITTYTNPMYSPYNNGGFVSPMYSNTAANPAHAQPGNAYQSNVYGANPNPEIDSAPVANPNPAARPTPAARPAVDINATMAAHRVPTGGKTMTASRAPIGTAGAKIPVGTTGKAPADVSSEISQIINRVADADKTIAVKDAVKTVPAKAPSAADAAINAENKSTEFTAAPNPAAFANDDSGENK